MSKSYLRLKSTSLWKEILHPGVGPIKNKNTLNLAFETKSMASLNCNYSFYFSQNCAYLKIQLTQDEVPISVLIQQIGEALCISFCTFVCTQAQNAKILSVFMVMKSVTPSRNWSICNQKSAK